MNIAAAEASVEESPNVSIIRRSHWASLWRRCGEFCEMILAYILTKSNWCQNWSHQKRRMFMNCAEWQNDKILSKNHLQQWGSFLAEWLRQYAKHALLVRQQSTRTPWVIIASRKNYGLVRFVGQRRHWTVLLPWWSRPARYCEYFWPQLDDMDLEDMWFQQDGATSHTANVPSLENVFSHVQSVGRLGS